MSVSQNYDVAIDCAEITLNNPTLFDQGSNRPKSLFGEPSSAAVNYDSIIRLWPESRQSAIVESFRRR